MKNEDDILKKAIEAVNSQPIEPGPGQEVINETLEKLPQVHHDEFKLRWFGFVKLAAAAVILIACGFLAGQMTTSVDTDEIISKIEPVITEKVRDELRSDMVTAFALVREKLHEDVQSELDRYAMQTLAVSNTVMNQRLAELASVFDITQQQDRWQIATALQNLEKERIIDDAIIYSELAQAKAQIASLPISFGSEQQETED